VSRSLAWALYNLGRFDNAERVYRRILELHPSDLTMQAGVGWCLLRRGRPAEAEAEFREVLRVAPENASARTGLASATAPR
jgi:Flp pilus assembly protein TadD